MNRILQIVLLLTIFSCAEIEQTPAPDPLYSKEQMATILYDLYLMDGSLQTNRRAFTDLKVAPDQYIYKKYDTDSISFANNLEYYTDRVEEYLEIIEMVEQKVDIKKDSLDAVKKETRELKVVSDTLAIQAELQPEK